MTRLNAASVYLCCCRNQGGHANLKSVTGRIKGVLKGWLIEPVGELLTSKLLMVLEKR